MLVKVVVMCLCQADSAAPVVLFDCGTLAKPVDANFNGIDLPIAAIAKVINNSKQTDVVVWISHADNDHESSISAVIEKLNNKYNNYNISYYCGGTNDKYDKYNSCQINCSQMQVFSGSNYSYDIVSQANGGNANAQSLMLLITTPENKQILITGDNEQHCQYDRSKIKKTLSFLTAPHHGAKKWI